MIELWTSALAGVAAGAAIAQTARLRSLGRDLAAERLHGHRLEDRLVEADARRAFEQRVEGALAVPVSEPDVLAVTLRALEELLPDAEVSYLLAHGAQPRVRFTMTLRNGRIEAPRLVSGPDSCAALATGRTAAVPTNLALDACPHVAEQSAASPSHDSGSASEIEMSSLCVPLVVDGRALGVLHARGPAGDLVDANTVARVEWLAQRAAERLWRLRVQSTRDTRLVADPLTGLPTRTGLETRARELDATGTPYCVVHCDLDGFILYNERHGREAGDRALQLASRVLSATVRPGDLAARVGDDEFAVLLANCHRPGAAAAMERARERLVLAETEAGVPPFTYSAGIAASDPTHDLDDLLDLAEAATEAAYLQGGNRVLAGDLDEPHFG